MPLELVQAGVEETLVLLLQPIGLATTAGYWKSLRHPAIRLTAAAFTASVNIISFRDEQVARKRLLVKLLENREERLENWAQTRRSINFFNLDWQNLKQDANDYQVWDTWHGKQELEYRLDKLYSTQAIWFKSLLVGASLGTLPILSRIKVDLLREEVDWRKVIEPDYLLNCWYARYVGLKAPYLKMDNGFFIEMAHEQAFLKVRRESTLNVLQEWRASSNCWYGRAGKLPLFQHSVEEEEE